MLDRRQAGWPRGRSGRKGPRKFVYYSTTSSHKG